MLVAVLDADKEGFLRNTRSLIQVIGRAARNVDGRVILYGNSVTRSMREAMQETDRRRAKQLAYNEEHGITPQTIRKAFRDALVDLEDDDDVATQTKFRLGVQERLDANLDRQGLIEFLHEVMVEAAAELKFEEAAALRDQIRRIQAMTAEAYEEFRQSDRTAQELTPKASPRRRVVDDDSGLRIARPQVDRMSGGQGSRGKKGKAVDRNQNPMSRTRRQVRNQMRKSGGSN
jgi:excinuclease ABC subunit B